MSIRQQIVDAIDARLRTIRVANGYQSDIGQRVYPWRVSTLADAEVPALMFFDTDCQLSDSGIVGRFTHDLQVDIVAEVSGASSRNAVRTAIADIFRAVGQDRTWGGLAGTTDIQYHGINLEQTERTIGSGLVRLIIQYTAPMWQM